MQIITRRSVLLWFTFGILTSCGPRSNVPLPEGALQPSVGKVQLVWSSDMETAHLYDNRSPVDSLLMSAFTTDSRQQRLQREKITPLVHRLFLDPFRRRLIDKGFSVSVKDEPVPVKELGSVIEKDSAYVIHMRVLRLGAQIRYMFFTESAPKVVADIDAVLLKYPENKIIAEQHPRKLIDAIGKEWGGPPEYLGLMTTIRHTLAEAIEEVEENFIPM